MLRLSSGKLLSPGISAWRCVQQTAKPPNSRTTAWQPSCFHASVCAPCGSPSKSQFLNIGRVSWHASRFCSRDSSHQNEGFSMKALTQSPKPALYLGFSGLIPFLSAPLLMAATQSYYPEVAYAQMAYGACIVSFLGGARWGFALPPGSPAQPDWMNLGNSVVPSLLAWLALLCKDNFTEGAMVVIMGLGLSLHYDLVLLPGYPPWFKAMRTILTLVATFSLVATLVLKKFCTEKKLRDIQN